MSKIVLISDTHFGVRGDNPMFLDNMKKFLDNVFFPYLDEHDIKTIVHLGDLLDKRKTTNNHTMFRLRTDFLDPLFERGVHLHLILGNHDLYFRGTTEVSSTSEILRLYPCDVYENPTEIDFNGLKILFLPWICDSNHEKSHYLIETSTAQVVFGHLEMNNFQMYRGQPHHGGFDSKTFDRFDVVCSGHFHHRSTVGNITYVGSPCEYTWGDYDDPRGFHVFDTETRELEFIQNPIRMFEKIWYDDGIGGGAFIAFDKDGASACDVSFCRSKIVKVIVKRKTSPQLFEQFITEIERHDPNDLQIVEDHLNIGDIDDAEIVDEAQDTLQICRQTIRASNMSDGAKVRVTDVITKLYEEACARE